VDLENNAFLVTRKGGNQVVLYFPPEVAEALAEYLEERDTIEALPGHEDALFLSGSAAKLSPPLPDEAGREAILAALADGTVDCLASYHLPCRRWEKQVPPEQAVAGAPSYRTALGVGLRWLVGTGVLSLPRLIAMMSEIPASLLGRESGLAVGGEAAFAVLGDGEEWTVGEGGNEAELLSPFSGQTLRGRIIHRFFDGRWS